MFDITALGEILIDFTPSEKENGNNTYCQNPGGAPANVLATISKYGGKTAFIGKVGNDMFGSYLSDILKSINVDTSGLAVDSVHNTTLAFVALDESGDRSFSFYRNFGADIFLNQNDIKTDIISKSRIFHFGSLSLTSEPAKSATDFALKAAKESGCIISFDPNYRELLWSDETTAVNTISDYIPNVDIMKVSREEAIMLSGCEDIGQASKKIANMGVKVLLITDGANGVTYQKGTETGYIPAIVVNATDTTGAGDIFFGTFLFEFIKNGKNISEISAEEIECFIKKAVVTSGLSTQINGAIPSIPEYGVTDNI